jgi:hypothetical protein
MIVPCPKIRLSKLLAGGECIVRWVESILLITISMCQRGFHHYSMCLPGKGGFAFLGVIKLVWEQGSMFCPFLEEMKLHVEWGVYYCFLSSLLVIDLLLRMVGSLLAIDELCSLDLA